VQSGGKKGGWISSPQCRVCPVRGSKCTNGLIRTAEGGGGGKGGRRVANVAKNRSKKMRELCLTTSWKRKR